MESYDDPFQSSDYDQGPPYASWFWYGRYEGAHGGYVPPVGFFPALMYWLGNQVGRRFGPPPVRQGHRGTGV